MTNGEAVNWLINITADIGKAEHCELWHYEQALSEIREMLESESERKRGEWIPCSERLPEKSGTAYLITFPDYNFYEDGRVLYVVDIFGYEDGKWVYDYEEDVEVIAWMPLPEPYKGEQT